MERYISISGADIAEEIVNRDPDLLLEILDGVWREMDDPQDIHDLFASYPSREHEAAHRAFIAIGEGLGYVLQDDPDRGDDNG